MARPAPADTLAPDEEDWVDAAPRVRRIQAADLPAAVFRVSRPVLFGDCDPAGIVYTPRFLDMAVEAVERFVVERLGVDYYAVIRGGTGLGFARVGVDFLRPATMGESLALAVRVRRIGGASAAFQVHAFRGEGEVMRASLVMVTTALSTARPVPLPAPLRAALAADQERCR